jgi:hypothetical protein
MSLELLKPPLGSPMPSADGTVMPHIETLYPPSGTKRNGDDEYMIFPPSKGPRIGQHSNIFNTWHCCCVAF